MEDALPHSVLNKLSIPGAQNFNQIKGTGTGTGTALDCFNNNFYLNRHRLEGESGPGSVTYPSICFSNLIVLNVFFNGPLNQPTIFLPFSRILKVPVPVQRHFLSFLSSSDRYKTYGQHHP